MQHLTPRDSGTPWVLFHGSDGSEHDLVPVVEELAPHAPHVALRGTVCMPGGYAFFERNEDRSLNEDDIRSRVPGTIRAIKERIPHARRQGVIGLGYSNGAIMLSALLHQEPALFAQVILLRPLTPYAFPNYPPLRHVRVLVLEAEHDARRSPGDAQRQCEFLLAAGAKVTHRIIAAEHPLNRLDIEAIRPWLKG